MIRFYQPNPEKWWIVWSSLIDMLHCTWVWNLFRRLHTGVGTIYHWSCYFHHCLLYQNTWKIYLLQNGQKLSHSLPHLKPDLQTSHPSITPGALCSSTVSATLLYTLEIQRCCRIGKYSLPTATFPMEILLFSLYWPISA